MKKIFILLFAIMFILPSVFALNLRVEKQSSDEVMIAGVNNPVTFDLRISNFGEAENLKFYNLLGFNMFPVGTFPIGANQIKNIELIISPIGEFNIRGAYTLNYFIRSEDTSELSQQLTFKVVELKDAFEIGSDNLDPESNSIEVYIHNKVNFDFENLNIKFNSAFFDFEEEISLASHKRINFSIQLEKDDFNKVMAGFYTLNVEINFKSKTINLDSVIEFVEKDLVTTTKQDYGAVVHTKIIKKINNGNAIAKTEIIIEKNILSRLFTSLYPTPDVVERKDFKIYYTWNREVKPGESLEIIVKTNWLVPVIIIFFLIAVTILVKLYSKRDLVLKKKVSFVRAKGGEFALKVTIFVKAQRFVEKISIIDRLPQLVKIYERFGGEQPVRVDEKKKRIEWNFESLDAGEKRILTYIIYSKLGIIGKFALPSATAIYERDGKIEESNSNKTFFVAEQGGRKE